MIAGTAFWNFWIHYSPSSPVFKARLSIMRMKSIKLNILTSMELIISLLIDVIIYVIFGILMAHIARKKKRNPIRWFLAGAIFGIYGFIVLLILPSLQHTVCYNIFIKFAPYHENEVNNV